MSETSPVTILFVSADEPSSLPHRTVLAQEGFTVCHARTGAEALDIAEEAPGLVIVNGHLPDLSGPEVCRRLKAAPHTAAVPVLRLCPPTEVEDEAAGWDGLADGWLTAPSPRTLLAQIKSLLRARRAERALRDSEALYHSLVEALPLCILRKDLRGRFTFANQPFCAELHCPLEEIVGCTDYDFYPVELADKYSHDDRRVLKTGTIFEDVEEHTADGQTSYVHVLKGPLRDSHGRVIGLQTVFWDVTARKRAEAEMERTATEMGVARRIQQKFFPRVPPPSLNYGAGQFDVGGSSHPADEIGGDYFDYLPLPDGALGVAIGDVSGHGVGPALLMAIARAYLRACAEAEADVGAILGRVNRLLAPDIEGDRYITMLLARIDPEARSLIYASAGHATGYVLGPTGEVKHALESTTMPLGISSQTRFPPSAPVALAAGDLVLLLTDGVVEGRDPHGRPFGAQRVLDLVRAHRPASAREIVESIYQGVRAFAENMPQDDDITATVIKIGPT
jgi:sigma-B regulation protein RsbU (phosphoserine phosphatase)